MLSERWLRSHPDEARASLVRRHAGPEALATLDAWLTLDGERRTRATQFDGLAADLKALGHDQPGDSAETRARRDALRAAVSEGRHTLAGLDERMRDLALTLPNAPDPRVPEGSGPRDNVVVRAWGEPAPLNFAPREHDTLGATLGILDLPRAAKLAGPRFPLLVGEGARLARMLAALMLDAHYARGYTEIAPPDLLSAATLTGSGHLPRHADELFSLPRDGFFLSPTAEAQLVALHAGETLAPGTLPLAYTAYTQAYRREAGSAGTRTRGLLRQRQFGKVELTRIVTPETADEAFDTLLADAEAILRQLDLPYRVVALCAGELPFSARRTYDLEVWLTGSQRWLEISSVSDCGDFQARRLRLRYHPRGGAPAVYPALLNGSALPIGRTLAALLERGQRADGSVALPPALERYGAPALLRPGKRSFDTL